MSEDKLGGVEICFGDYGDGRYAYRLENIQALPEPVFVRGQLGLWNWDTGKDE